MPEVRHEKLEVHHAISGVRHAKPEVHHAISGGVARSISRGDASGLEGGMKLGW